MLKKQQSEVAPQGSPLHVDTAGKFLNDFKACLRSVNAATDDERIAWSEWSDIVRCATLVVDDGESYHQSHSFEQRQARRERGTRRKLGRSQRDVSLGAF